ncbi:MAG: anaerobic ribonucleoside-triphosphate reductase activating protein [Bacteroidales bacterium]|nr:anaerobic ribonucleoside-triphosphate reductase activating protein [Bacteroidales bacterium]
MLIGGFIHQSFIDYPSKMAAVVFTAGCNFRCWYCHNPHLVLPSLIQQNQIIPVEEVLSRLSERKNWLEGVVITGGEPTLHNDLPTFIEKLKDMGYLVKLDTNGSNPGMLSKILANKRIDYVAMDIKNILEPQAYNEIIDVYHPSEVIEKVKTSIEIIKQSGIDYEFRTTKVPGIHTPEIITQIKVQLGPVKRYTTHDYRNENTLMNASCENKT